MIHNFGVRTQKFYSIIVENNESAYIAMFFLFGFMYDKGKGSSERVRTFEQALNWELKNKWEQNKNKILIGLDYAQVMKNGIPMKNAKIGFNPFLALAMVKKKLGIKVIVSPNHKSQFGVYTPSDEMLLEIKTDIDNAQKEEAEFIDE